MGFLLAATNRTLDDLIDMNPVERDFLAYWVREREYDQMKQLGRLLGVMFTASEVRAWKPGEGGVGEGYEDPDQVLVPLTFALRPETKEAIQKMVGAEGLKLPEGYKSHKGEMVIDMGRVSPEEFKEWVERNRVMPREG